MIRKLLAIYGSPRAGSNSSGLLDAAAGVFERSGFEIDRIRTAGAAVGPCRGCLACEKTGRCVQDDAMAPFYGKLLDADLIFFATPVYFYSVPGPAKIFMDRCQALWALKYRFPDRFAQVSKPGRMGYAIGAGATRGKRLFEGMRLTFRYFFDAVGAEFKDMIEFRRLENSGDYLKDPGCVNAVLEWAEEIRISVDGPCRAE